MTFCLVFFLLAFLLIFFLPARLLTLEFSMSEEEEREVDSTFDEEGEWLTWGWFSCGKGLGSDTKGAFGMTGLENNHTGNPIVNSGRFKVAVKGGQTAPQGGDTKDIPWKGFYWLVVPGESPISELSKNLWNTTQDQTLLKSKIHKKTVWIGVDQNSWISQDMTKG